jgi:hypothetical protein
MVGRGVHFALTQAEARVLLKLSSEQERFDHLRDEIDGRYLQEPATYAAESDEAWEAMHRALADGHLTQDGGTYPLNHAVLAGKLLSGENERILSLKTPAQVRDIAEALEALTEEQFGQRYLAIDASEYGTHIEDHDLAYTWEWFLAVRDLYRLAANEGRYVLFTTSP